MEKFLLTDRQRRSKHRGGDAQNGSPLELQEECKIQPGGETKEREKEETPFLNQSVHSRQDGREDAFGNTAALFGVVLREWSSRWVEGVVKSS